MAKRKLETRARKIGSRTHRTRLGTWTDFSSKHGFDDGDKVTDLDVQARNRIVAVLNVELKGHGVTAVGYDRPGLHNYCLILILPNPDSASPGKLRKRFFKEPDFHEVPLPDTTAKRIEEIIAAAYERVSGA